MRAIVRPQGAAHVHPDRFRRRAGTRKIDQLLAHYEESHRDPRNERIHFVAIPLIMVSLLGLLFAIHPWVAYGFVLASLVYYARLSLVWLVTMAVLSAIALALVHAMGERVLTYRP